VASTSVAAAGGAPRHPGGHFGASAIGWEGAAGSHGAARLGGGRGLRPRSSCHGPRSTDDGAEAIEGGPDTNLKLNLKTASPA
jgi:hypothetical protein